MATSTITAIIASIRQSSAWTLRVRNTRSSACRAISGSDSDAADVSSISIPAEPRRSLCGAANDSRRAGAENDLSGRLSSGAGIVTDSLFAAHAAG